MRLLVTDYQQGQLIPDIGVEDEVDVHGARWVLIIEKEVGARRICQVLYDYLTLPGGLSQSRLL